MVGVRVRRSLGSGTRAVATIDVAEGYLASVIKQQLLCSWASNALPQSSSPWPAHSALAGTSGADTPVQKMDHYSDLDRVPTPQPDVLIPISGGINPEKDDPNVLKPQTPPPRPHVASPRCSASPALTYVTVVEPLDREADTAVVQNAHGTSDERRDDADPVPLGHFAHSLELSSDQESDMDGSVVLDEPPRATFLQRATSEENLAERLLLGPIDTVDDFLEERGMLDDHLRPILDILPRGSTSTSCERERGAGTGRGTRSMRHALVQQHPPAREAAPARADARSARAPPPDASSSSSGNVGVTITLPKTTWAKGRRLLVPSSADLPIAAVYMRGDVQFMNQGRR